MAKVIIDTDGLPENVVGRLESIIHKAVSEFVSAYKNKTEPQIFLFNLSGDVVERTLFGETIILDKRFHYAGVDADGEIYAYAEKPELDMVNGVWVLPGMTSTRAKRNVVRIGLVDTPSVHMVENLIAFGDE